MSECVKWAFTPFERRIIASCGLLVQAPRMASIMKNRNTIECSAQNFMLPHHESDIVEVGVS